MKPFLGMDMTTDRKNELPNGEEFLVTAPSDATVEEMEQAADEAEQTLEKCELPLPLRIVKWVCAVVALIAVVSYLKARGKNGGMPLSQLYENAPWLFWVGGICACSFGGFSLCSAVAKHVPCWKPTKANKPFPS